MRGRGQGEPAFQVEKDTGGVEGPRRSAWQDSQDKVGGRRREGGVS